ncbi:protein DMP3-like [Neltuma alba]|uniref:protein DMP3-like n=1 Tax=Neltuma alba TaxID=207710 RepID=UPI0010A5118D|nr:protein DMP3-like [Prosopis alba]
MYIYAYTQTLSDTNIHNRNFQTSLQHKKMSVRQRPITTKQPSTSEDSSSEAAALVSPEKLQPPPTPSSTSRPQQAQGAISRTLTSTANLANLLPTGTLLAFQILTPIFTSNGTCNDTTRLLTVSLLAVLAVSCFLASFTDSVEVNGKVYHGLATFKGMWLFDYPVDASGSDLPDMSKKKVRLLDFIHAVLSLAVFVAVAMRDRNVVSCLYPSPAVETKQVLDIVPVGIGLICSLLFVVFPTTRHGVGYPVTPSN